MALAAARVADRIHSYGRGSGYEAAVRVLSSEWRSSSRKAERRLGYSPMPVREGIEQVLKVLNGVR